MSKPPEPVRCRECGRLAHPLLLAEDEVFTPLPDGWWTETRAMKPRGRQAWAKSAMPSLRTVPIKHLGYVCPTCVAKLPEDHPARVALRKLKSGAAVRHPRSSLHKVPSAEGVRVGAIRVLSE